MKTLPPELLHKIGKLMDETTLTRARRTGRFARDSLPSLSRPLAYEAEYHRFRHITLLLEKASAWPLSTNLNVASVKANPELRKLIQRYTEKVQVELEEVFSLTDFTEDMLRDIFYLWTLIPDAHFSRILFGPILTSNPASSREMNERLQSLSGRSYASTLHVLVTPNVDLAWLKETLSCYPGRYLVKLQAVDPTGRTSKNLRQVLGSMEHPEVEILDLQESYKGKLRKRIGRSGLVDVTVWLRQIDQRKTLSVSEWQYVSPGKWAAPP
jgi:hypothetical protein